MKTSCATQCFEKLFSTYLDWVFSWFLNLESWILILIILESWNLILEYLLNSWFFGIIKITLEDIASTLWSFENYTLKFKPHLRHKILCSVSLHSSSPIFKLLSLASYGGELVLDSSFPWSGISSHLSSFSIPLPLNFKKKRTPLMQKIKGLQAPHGATPCGIKSIFI